MWIKCKKIPFVDYETLSLSFWRYFCWFEVYRLTKGPQQTLQVSGSWQSSARLRYREGNRLTICGPFALSSGIQKPNQNPGVAPPDGALLFCRPKRVSRKGPALRWACLARQGGNLNSVKTVRLNVYISLIGPEALESLSFCGELLLWPCFSGFSLVSHTAREAPR